MLGHVQVGVSCEDFLQIDEISSKVRGKKHDTILQIYSQKNIYLSVCVCMHRYVCMYACMHMQLQTLVGVFPPRSIYVLFLVVDSGNKRRFSQFSRHSWRASGLRNRASVLPSSQQCAVFLTLASSSAKQASWKWWLWPFLVCVYLYPAIRR